MRRLVCFCLLLVCCFCVCGFGDIERKRKAALCFGRIEFVNYNEDFRVRVVSCNADLRVCVVNTGDAERVGEWRISGANSRWRVLLVNYNEDFTVQFVSDNPGLND